MKSWIESANDPQSHFPVQNLPFGAALFQGGKAQCASAIGDQIVNLAILEKHGLLNTGTSASLFDQPNINQFMAQGAAVWQSVRNSLTELLVEGGDTRLKNNIQLQQEAINSIENVTMLLPFEVAEYTDFYAGRQHATNVGTMFRGSQDALPPNWLHIPIGYNGRASTVVVSGTAIRRPLGQLKPPNAEKPHFGPCKRLDLELELGAVVGSPTKMGQPITVEQADEMIFGYVLLNDWSARDIQAWEYQPLGPFQAKAFATSISPWVITKAALEQFRVSTPQREKPLLAYLQELRPMLYDIELEIQIRPSESNAATTLCQTNYANMYYSAPQQLAHHASSGCKMNTGDLLGSGTISGANKSEYGSLLEMSWGGKEPITLDCGSTRTFIEDGDTLTLTGWTQGDGFKIGFGTCTGKIIPAIDWPPKQN